MPYISLSPPLKEDDRTCALCKKIGNTWWLMGRLAWQALPRLFALDHHLKVRSVMLSDSLKWWYSDRQNRLAQTIAVCCCSNLCCVFRQQDRLSTQCGSEFPIFLDTCIPTLPAYSHRSWDTSATQLSYKMSCTAENTSLILFSLQVDFLSEVAFRATYPYCYLH